MNNIAIIADCHLGQYWRTNSNRALKLIDTFKNTLIDIRKQTDNLVIMGDLYHSVNLPPDCLSYIHDKIYDELKTFKEVIIVIGNHETFLDVNNNQKSLPGLLLSNITTVLEKPLQSITICGKQITTLPHCADMERILEFMATNDSEALKTINKSIIFGHFTPKEIFERSRYVLTPVIDKLNPNMIILGDYHMPETKVINNTTIISIGSTYYGDISDVSKHAVKRYLLMDMDTLEITSHPINLCNIIDCKITDIDQLPNIFNDDKDSIYYIESNIPLDLTQYIVDGYDIYFNYISGSGDINSMVDISLDKSNFVNVDDSWQDYVNIQHCDDDVKRIANNIFRNRNNLNVDSIIGMFEGSNISAGINDR